MKNKNFIPKGLIEEALYKRDRDGETYSKLQLVFKKKTFLQFKYEEVQKILDTGRFSLPSHNVEKYSVGELFERGTVDGVKIPSGRSQYYLFSMYLSNLLGIEKKPTGKESFETIKEGIYLLMLEFDITSIIKYQELMIKITSDVLTGEGSLVVKKEKLIDRDIRGGHISE